MRDKIREFGHGWVVVGNDQMTYGMVAVVEGLIAKETAANGGPRHRVADRILGNKKNREKYFSNMAWVELWRHGGYGE